MAPPISAHLPTAPLALGLLLGTGCEHDGRQPVEPRTIAPIAAERASDVLRRQLASQAVYHTRAARRVLYSWTTAAQVAALHTFRTLLVRDGSPERGLGLYATLLAHRAEAGDPIASLLQHKAFVRLRFAWTNPWATCCGSDGAAYGDHLIRVELRPDAWIGRLDTAMLTWRFFDLDDRPVTAASVLAHPERLAAVYFVQVPASERHPDAMLPGMLPLGHREFVLCNESMIAEWSVGTTEIARALDEAQTVVRLVAAWSASDQVGAYPADTNAWNAAVLARSWTRPDPLAAPRSLYEASLAFPTSAYRPEGSTLDAIANRLASVPTDAALRVEPDRHFDLGIVVPVATRSARRSMET